MRTEEAHGLAPEAKFHAWSPGNPGARDPQRDIGVTRIGTGDGLPERFLEADAAQRIEERVNLAARQPSARTCLVQRNATGSRNVPALAQHDLVGCEPAAIDPDLLQMLRNGIARKQIACCRKAQPRRITSLQPRLPDQGIAYDVGLEAAPGLVDRCLEIRWRTGPLRHLPQRQPIRFNPRALGLLPALDQ